MTLRPAGNKPGWFVGTREELQGVVGLPGTQHLSGELWRVHRSHLPLLPNSPEAAKILLPGDLPDRTGRNRNGIVLRPTQHTAIDFITQRRGTLLGDDMRLGKTLTAIMSHDPARGKFVVVCPAMVRPVWIGWLKKAFPDEPIGIMAGRSYDPKVVQHKIVVGHYDILDHWLSGAPIGTLVFDEAHALTNRNASRSKAAVYLAMRAAMVICATGTPIWNMPTDLWNVVGMLVPGALGSFHDFAGRYGNPEPGAHGTKYKGISNGQELSARMSDIMIRRRWIDVVDNLPPITRGTELIELTDAQKFKLDLFAAEVSTGNHATTIGALARYREKLASLKIKAAVARIQKTIDKNEPVVVWTWHVKPAQQIVTQLEANGRKAFLLTGEIPLKKRDEIIAQWRATPNGALVCTMSVAQVGLDFSHAWQAIFVEIDWTPAIIAQAEMRTYDSTRGMDILYLIVDHVIEQRILLALIKKLGASSPLGVSAADDAISVLSFAFQGPVDVPDLDRLLDDLLVS